MKKKITFIINPLAGDIIKTGFPDLIKQYLDQDRFDVEISFTKNANDNSLLAAKAVADKRDVVVAVGGDGTINHVAKHLAGTSILFGVVPFGSGNGMARHLQIPLDGIKALQTINKLHYLSLDSGMANNVFFINAAGVGFDAHVTHVFAHADRRGLISYAKIVLKEFRSYLPRKYELIIDGEKKEINAFVLCIANGSQYGNNAWIAPLADMEDGIFEVSIINPFRLFHVPMIVLDLFRKKFHCSKYVSVFRGKDIYINRKEKEVVNIDGEPILLDKNIHFKMHPRSLNVIVPEPVKEITEAVKNEQ